MSARVRVSVLIPTRGRPAHLHQSVTSLHAAASGSVEYVIRTDSDAAPERDALVGCFEGLSCLELRGERHGYAGIYRYYDEMAKAARGEWLLVWNDDIDMLTQGWDDLLAAGDGLVQFPRRDIRPNADDSVPLVHRRVYEALGRLSPHCFVDTWLSHVAMAAGVRQFRDDVSFHHHRVRDELSNIRDAVVQGEYATFRAMGPERWDDATRLRKALDREYA